MMAPRRRSPAVPSARASDTEPWIGATVALRTRVAPQEETTGRVVEHPTPPIVRVDWGDRVRLHWLVDLVRIPSE